MPDSILKEGKILIIDAKVEKQSGRQFDAETVTAYLTLPHQDLLQ